MIKSHHILQSKNLLFITMIISYLACSFSFIVNDIKVSKLETRTYNFISTDTAEHQNQKRLKVLCLHGYLSSAKYFKLQLRKLVDDTDNIADFGMNIIQYVSVLN